MLDTVTTTATRLTRKVRGVARAVFHRIEPFVRRPQPEEALVADAQAYWNGSDALLPQHAHVRGAGVFEDDRRWLAMGRRHLELHRSLARMTGRRPELDRVVEWGCGGGANLVAFAPLARRYVGIDISREALQACEAEAARTDLDEFLAFEIDAADPDAALEIGRASTDLFLCTYVLELVPTPEYGLRILGIAAQLLVAGGLAIVQIKHTSGHRSSRSRPWDYRRNLASNTLYPIEVFWEASRAAGLDPLAISLVPRDELTDDGPYAYFLLQRPEPAGQPAKKTLATS